MLEWFKVIVPLILSWPVVTFIIFFTLLSPLKKILSTLNLSKIKKIGPTGLEFESIAKQTVIETLEDPEVTKKLKLIMSIMLGETKDKQQDRQALDERIKISTPEELEKDLKRILNPNSSETSGKTDKNFED